jgi:hypothetical protein
MRGFLAVLRREMEERRLLLLAAVAAGFFPFLLPYLPGFEGRDPVDVRGGAALALSVVVGGVLALGLGATVIAGDLAERRLGFYFARPIAGWALWGGKLAGAAVLAVGASLLVLLPALLTGGRTEVSLPWWLGDSLLRAGIPTLVAGTLAVLLLAHVLSSMARSRSPWLLLDLAAVLAFAAVTWSACRVLWQERAFSALSNGVAGLALAAGAAALAAAAVQVTAGRTDPRRGHRLLSLTFWGALGVAALGFSAYTRWVTAVTPADLTWLAPQPAPAGSWIGLRGLAAGRGDYAPAFLFDAASGRWRKIGAVGFYRWLPLIFSPDGERAIWLAPDGTADGRGIALRTLDLRDAGARPAAPPLTFRDWPQSLALTPHGERLASVDDGTLTVADLATGRLLASASLATPSGESVELRFRDPGHLLIYQSSEEPAPGGRSGSNDSVTWRLTTLELPVPRGRLTVTGRLELAGDVRSWALSPDGERVVARLQHALRVLDLRTGALLAARPLAGETSAADLLTDGRILVTEHAGGRTQLSLLSRDGMPLRRFAFDADRLQLGGEVAAGRLALATARRGKLRAYEAWTAVILDLDSGRTALVGRGLLPVGRPGLGPQSAGARLFSRRRDLLLLDPATGRLRTVLRWASHL